MKNKLAACLIVLATIAPTIFFTGCAENVDQVREYADPITENILLGMNENNYTKYSEHFDQTMKNAMPESVFNETNAIIKSKIGDYASKEFWKAETKDQFTIVYYKAEFTQEPETVIVKIVFQEIAGEIKVSGLWLNSPELRKK